MTTVQPSSIARAAFIHRLSDPTNGFNPRFLAGVQALGYQLPSSFRTPIDFTSTSKNFFEIDVEPDTLAQTSPYTLPMMTLFPVASQNARLERPRQFAGPVVHGCNIFLSWPSSKAAKELVPLVECAQNALISSLNERSLSNWEQIYANSLLPDVNIQLVWGGDITIQYSRIVPEQESWQQGIGTRLTMEVFTE